MNSPIQAMELFPPAICWHSYVSNIAMQPSNTDKHPGFAQRMIGLTLFLVVCCVFPYSCYTQKPPEWGDLDNVRVGMTLGEVYEAYPYELVVNPVFDQMPKFEEYLRTSGKSLKSFNGSLRRRDGMGLSVNSGAIFEQRIPFDENGAPQFLEERGIIGKNALDYVKKSGQDWRIVDYGDLHLNLKTYLARNMEAKQGFSGELDCSVFDGPFWIWGYYMTVHVKNGRVTSTERDVIYD